MARRTRSPRYVTTLMMALIGVMLIAAFMAEDAAAKGDVTWADLPKGLMLRYLLAMAIGGALAGWLLSGMFGRRGVGGFMLGFLGSVIATLVAGLFGSAAGLLPDLLRDGWSSADLIPVLYGLAVLPLAFAGQPLLFVGWLVLMLLTHLWARRIRGV
ncbi:hypothetical protein [Salipiger mangrovisoli]|uniref:Uncharacterized protein n=1 Tax=Salipiger mangrovisoli TaxID=2865933 RepID=A0ABR9WZS6_9RHOB|nr:hypothetical protein [Salipiger mangrovisoli]MBE9636797.1 hypothetical protein [Salipiger mangrovisoli]